MDFFALSKEEYKNYMTTVRSLMREKGFKHEGVAFYVISGMPKLETLAKGGAHTAKDLPQNLYEEFCGSYVLMEKTFLSRFDMFFERCVKDETLRSDLKNTFGMAEEYVSRFIDADGSDFAAAYDKTADGNTYDNAEIFSEILNCEGFDIKKEIEECRKRCYY